MFSKVSESKACFDFATSLYKHLIHRINVGEYDTQPYPIPSGYKAHGIPMILLNTTCELLDTLDKMDSGTVSGPRFRRELVSQIDLCLETIISDFMDSEGLIHEFIRIGCQRRNTILENYLNPGHCIEDAWFMIHAMEKTGSHFESFDKIIHMLKRVVKLGWDQTEGGLYLFIGFDGQKPTGDVSGIDDLTMVRKIEKDWEKKLWWPHAEALYSTLLGYEKTKDEDFLNMYWQIHKYTFLTFPNQDKKVGEWIQIRDRKGRPVQENVALPVKDPFHIARSIMMIIEMLDHMA